MPCDFRRSARRNCHRLQNRETRARSYFEDGVFQSEATPDGTSLFAYAYLMARLLWPARRCAVALACAAGSLATMLQLQGKRVTLAYARSVELRTLRVCFLACQIRGGLRSSMISATISRGNEACFDAIGIDIGAPGMRFDGAVRPAEYACGCALRLATKGQIVMNIVASHYIDPKPDRTPGGARCR